MEIGTDSTLTVPIIAITSSQNFNHFFTIIFVFGAFAYYSSIFIRIIRMGYKNAN